MSILDTAMTRSAIGEHDGRSGAALERVVLADGRRLIVKRSRWQTDLVRRASNDLGGREGQLWRAGALPMTSIVDAWVEGDESVVVMRDLGDTVFGWHRVLTAAEVGAALESACALHAKETRSEFLVPLETRAGILSPARIGPLAGEFALAQTVVDGWAHFDAIADPDLLALRDDPAPVIEALGRRRHTMIHGDLWPVNVAFTVDGPVFLDWGLAGWAPPAMDLVAFLAGAGAAHMAVTREAAIARFQELSGRHRDDTALKLALLLGLFDFGWNKALDAATAPTASGRARHRADLDWWLARAHDALRLSPSI